VLAVAGLSDARAATTVEVLATDPPEEVVTLGKGQNYYLRIGYSTDRPVQIWARPYFRGEPARAGSNPSPVYPAGSGEALGWFFLFEPGTQVDEIRITAGDGSRSGTQLVASHAVDITGGSRPPLSTRATPAWVTKLGDEQDRLVQEAVDARASVPTTVGDTVLFSGFMLAVLAAGIGGLVAPVWAMRRWSGGWRVAAALPLVAIGFVVLRIVAGVAVDPTSHNLWPFEILQVGGISLAAMAVLLLARKAAGKRGR
jgi:hypothetical protein